MYCGRGLERSVGNVVRAWLREECARGLRRSVGNVVWAWLGENNFQTFK